MWLVQSHTTWSRGAWSKSQILLPLKLGSSHPIPCRGSEARRFPETEMVLNLGISPKSIWKAKVAVDELGRHGLWALQHLSNARKAESWLSYNSVLVTADFLVWNINKKHLLKMQCRVERAPGQGIQSSGLCSTSDKLWGLKQEWLLWFSISPSIKWRRGTRWHPRQKDESIWS